MMVELEVFDYDMEKVSLIGPAPYAARFAADIRMTNNNFGLMVDLSHFPTTYETSKFVVQILRPYITHFHIGNAVVKKVMKLMGINIRDLASPTVQMTWSSWLISFIF